MYLSILLTSPVIEEFEETNYMIALQISLENL